MHDYRVLIGAVSWRHAGWRGNFYPDDLPEEWQLGFYGNEFRVAMLPAAEWPADARAVADLLTDCGDSLVFICELPVSRCDEADWPANLRILQSFGDRLLGVIVPLQAAALARHLAEHCRVCIDTGSHSTQAQQLAAADARLGICWRGEGAADILQHGRLAVARVDGAAMTPRALRSILEALLAAQDPQRYLVLLIDGAPPSLEQLRNAQLLVDLL
jgi:hypothetical protein